MLFRSIDEVIDQVQAKVKAMLPGDWQLFRHVYGQGAVTALAPELRSAHEIGLVLEFIAEHMDDALTAASVAALTVYDMIKAVDKSAVIESVRLLSKSGGKSGTYAAHEKTPSAPPDEPVQASRGRKAAPRILMHEVAPSKQNTAPGEEGGNAVYVDNVYFSTNAPTVAAPMALPVPSASKNTLAARARGATERRASAAKRQSREMGRRSRGFI